MPDLRESYSKRDKKPFGTYIAYNQVEQLFNKNTVRETHRSFADTYKDISDKEALYICITKNLFLNEEEASAMLQYVEKGNDLFISASYIDRNLLKKIPAEQSPTFVYEAFNFDSMRNTTTGFEAAHYGYFYFPFTSYLSPDKNPLIKTIGINEKGKTNCIVYFYGKGKLFLHNEPRAFSNYFLLQKDNYNYLQRLLGYAVILPEHLYWDDYYNKLTYRKSGHPNNFSTLEELWRHPALKNAFLLSLLLLALYILFGGKRRQRIIAPVKQNENTTITFTETIGRLYLQKGDNKNIAEKMITYFNEYIRNSYFMNITHVNNDFISTLSRKSGVDRDKVEILYRAIAQVQQNHEVSDYELLSLNELIQLFYKRP